MIHARRQIAISDRYEAITEDDESESSRRVPIEDLIVKDTGKHRLRKRKGKVRSAGTIEEPASNGAGLVAQPRQFPVVFVPPVIEQFPELRRKDDDSNAEGPGQDARANRSTMTTRASSSSTTAAPTVTSTAAAMSTTTTSSRTLSASYTYDKFAVYPMGAVGNGAFTKSRAEPTYGDCVPHVKPRAPRRHPRSSLERFMMARSGQGQQRVVPDPGPIDGLASGSSGGSGCADGCCSMGYSSWAKLKAIQNYEKFIRESLQIDIENTVIDTVERTSLGVEGCALYDFGNQDDDMEYAPSLQPEAGDEEDAKVLLACGHRAECGTMAPLARGHRAEALEHEEIEKNQVAASVVNWPASRPAGLVAQPRQSGSVFVPPEVDGGRSDLWLSEAGLSNLEKFLESSSDGPRPI